ncbi:MAG: hypothetical protein N4A53_01570 [Pelagimonas sp.]|nr:hypothetical protein [Pelagimonas sp.]
MHGRSLILDQKAPDRIIGSGDPSGKFTGFRGFLRRNAPRRQRLYPKGPQPVRLAIKQDLTGFLFPQTLRLGNIGHRKNKALLIPTDPRDRRAPLT